MTLEFVSLVLLVFLVSFLCVPLIEVLRQSARGVAKSEAYPRISKLSIRTARILLWSVGILLTLGFSSVLFFAADFDLFIVFIIGSILLLIFYFSEART